MSGVLNRPVRRPEPEDPDRFVSILAAEIANETERVRRQLEHNLFAHDPRGVSGFATMAIQGLTSGGSM